MKISSTTLAVLFLTSLATCVLAASAEPQQDAMNTPPASARPIRTGYAPVNGLKIYFEIHGTADGKNPPIVLLRGGGSTIETSFSETLPLFAQKRQVIAFEQKGHGHTADDDRPFSFEDSADDTAALLHFLHVERADVCGYSGGHVALQVAIRHSAIARKLIVISAMFRRDGFYSGVWEGMKHANPDNLPAELRDAYLRVAPHPENFRSFSDKGVARMREFKDWPAESIRSIAAPTLLMLGDTDIVRPEHAVEMIRILPHGRFAILPATDHMQIVKRIDWVVSMVEAFLDAS